MFIIDDLTILRHFKAGNLREETNTKIFSVSFVVASVTNRNTLKHTQIKLLYFHPDIFVFHQFIYSFFLQNSITGSGQIQLWQFLLELLSDSNNAGGFFLFININTFYLLSVVIGFCVHTNQ